MLYMPTQIEKTNIINLVFEKIVKKCIRVELSTEEYILCDETSYKLWAAEKKGRYGEGLINSPEDEAKAQRIGLLGQMAFGKLIKEPVDLKYRKGGDKYDNIILNKYKIDIKCGSKNNSSQMYVIKKTEKGWELEIDKDIYVGCFVEFEDRKNKKATIIFTGFCLKDEVLSATVENGRKGGKHINYVIPYGKLHSIVELVNLINKFKKKEENV